MIWSLNDLSLICISDYIAAGVMPTNLEKVSQHLRQEILKTMTKRRQLSNQNCVNYLKHPLFFGNSFYTIDILPFYKDSDHDCNSCSYLGFLQGMGPHFQSHSHLLHRITTLRLLCVEDVDGQNDPDPFLLHTDKRPSRFHSVMQIIGKCQNLLHLTMIFPESLTDTRRRRRSVLHHLTNEIQASGTPGLETLELKYLKSVCNFRLAARQKLAFRRLKHLRLERVLLEEGSWTDLLESCQNSLISLELIRFGVIDGRILPIQLEQLRSFRHTNGLGLLDLSEVAILCPQLESCHLELWDRHLTPESFEELAQLPLSAGDSSIVEATINFHDPMLVNKLVDELGSKITKLTFNFEYLDGVTEESARRVMANCPNVSVIMIRADNTRLPVEISDRFVNAVLSDKQRMRCLREFHLNTPVSDQTMDLLFTNCSNLDVLDVSDKNQLIDQHLLTWAASGARPSHICISSSRLTNVGINALLKASGLRLQELQILSWNQQQDSTNDVIDSLVEFCPMVKCVNVPEVSDRIRENYDSLRRKFFHFVDII